MQRHLSRSIQTVLSSQRFALALAICTCAFILAIGEMVGSIQERESRARHYAEAIAQASTLRARIEREMNSLLYLNSGLGSYLIVRGDTLQAKEVNDILTVLYQSSRHVRNFGVAVGDRLTYVYPKTGNERAIGMRYRDNPDQWPVIHRIIESRQPVLAGPIRLVQGGSGLIYRVPLFIEGRYFGLLSTVIDTDSFFAAIFEQRDQGSFSYALRSDSASGIEAKALCGDQSVFSHRGAVTQEINVPGGHWTIAVERRPNPPLLNLRVAIRTMSLTLAILISGLLYMLMRNRVELAHLVMYDSLTGLPNRRLLLDRHEMVLARLQRDPERDCALLFLDLNGFKQINDQYGHETGDAVLQQTAQRLRAMLRSNDTVARWGGDEFVMLLEHVTQESLMSLVDRLHEETAGPIEFKGKTLRVSSSIGVAFYPPNGGTLEEILRVADQQMYHDKSRQKLAEGAEPNI